MFKITRIKVKRNKNRKEFNYTYIQIIIFKIINISVGKIGLTNMDIRIGICWGRSFK